MALLDHRRELRQEPAVRLAASDARELGPEGQMRLATCGDLGEQRRQLGVAREARGAQGRRTPRLVSRQRLAQEGDGLSVLRLGEGPQSTRIELALARAASDEDGRGLSQRSAQRGTERRDRPDRARELGFGRRPSLPTRRRSRTRSERASPCRAARRGPRGAGPRTPVRTFRVPWRAASRRYTSPVRLAGPSIPLAAASPSPPALPRPRASRSRSGPYQRRGASPLRITDKNSCR